MIAWEESPRQFKMSKQLDEGKFGEDLARKFLNDPIIKVNHGISHYDDVTQDKSYQDKDTDFIVWKKNGKTFGLEAKVDSHNSWEGLTIGAGRFHCRPVREKWRCGFHGRFG